MNKKIYPFILVTILLMSFIVTYYDNEGNSKFNAFAQTQNTQNSQNPVTANAKTPLKEVKYDIDRSGVEHDTKILYNDEKYVDYEQVMQEGSDGLKKSVYQECYVDGKLVSKSLEEEFIIKDPVDKIIEVGTNEYEVATSRGGFRFENELDMVASAYDLSFESCGKNPGDPYYGITASGTKAQPGTVAVDPRVIPLGTKLYIASTDGSPDYGFATALDTGGAIKGNRIDLFMEDNSDANNYGIRQVKVYVLE
jgi:3D (Asp-Asp-Asp) domain-containing protein